MPHNEVIVDAATSHEIYSNSWPISAKILNGILVWMVRREAIYECCHSILLQVLINLWVQIVFTNTEIEYTRWDDRPAVEPKSNIAEHHSKV